MGKRGLAGDDETESVIQETQGGTTRPKTARGEGAPGVSETREGSQPGSEAGGSDAGDEREYMEDDSGMRVEHMDAAECAFLYDEIFVRRCIPSHVSSSCGLPTSLPQVSVI